MKGVEAISEFEKRLGNDVHCESLLKSLHARARFVTVITDMITNDDVKEKFEIGGFTVYKCSQVQLIVWCFSWP